MYWNLDIVVSNSVDAAININMRCIEINSGLSYHVSSAWLTLTWDVLKFEFPKVKLVIMVININMRCIEILDSNYSTLICTTININMRCIEITMGTDYYPTSGTD